MNTSSRFFYIFLFLIASTVVVLGQDFAWEHVTTPQNNFLQIELITEQGYLIASGKGTFVSTDKGLSWAQYSETVGFNYVSIGSDLFFNNNTNTFKIDLLTNVFDTIYSTSDINWGFNTTGSGGLSFVQNNTYTVVDTDGNLISETPITGTSYLVRDVFIDAGYPSYIFGYNSFSKPYIVGMTMDFEVTGDKTFIPESANYEYYYSKGVLYSSQGKTSDGGESFTTYNLPTTAGSVLGFNLIDETLYVVTENALFISQDMGFNFEEKPHFAKLLGRAFVHANNGIISISTRNRIDNKILVSQDGGNSWTDSDGLPSSQYHGVAANSLGEVLSLNTGGYYDGYSGLEALENDAFIVSDDEKFCIVANGQTDLNCTDFFFYEFFYGIFVKKDKVYVANNNEIMVSSDGGDSFQSFEAESLSPGGGSEFDAWPPMAFLDNNKFLFVDEIGGGGNIFVLFDLSTSSRTELSKEKDYDVFLDLETSWTGPEVYILEYADQSQSELSLWHSSDEGLSFTSSILDISVIAESQYFLLTDHNDNIFIYSDKQLFINQDSQGSWVDLSTGLDLSDDAITDMTVSFDDYIYISLLSGGIFRSACKIDESITQDCFMMLFVDMDNDGYAVDVDCNDNDEKINPGADEICNDLDDNCDGEIDEGFTQISYFADVDGDGFGDAAVLQTSCLSTFVGYVENQDDCDDTDPQINPNAEEIPDNGIDENCDGMDLSTVSNE